ncbi:MAG: hypothetical protein BRD30_05760, partial [Bacteroidetes bacterium QH_2_63_10]
MGRWTAVAAAALLMFAPFAVQAQPTIDGDLTDSEYNALDNADGEDGFGGGASVRNLRWYVDDVNENLYVAVAGSLGTEVVFGDLNNIGIWVNVTGGETSPSGIPAGDTLGIKIDEDHRYLTGNFASADDPDANTNF